MAVYKAQEKEGFVQGIINWFLRTGVSLVIPVVTFLVLFYSFRFLRDSEANKFLIAVVAISVGVLGVWALFWSMDILVSRVLPTDRLREIVRPFVFVGPALVILGAYLVYPTIDTIWRSFHGPQSENFIGLQNYVFVFTTQDLLIAMRNNVLWLVIGTTFTVSFGLVIAVLVDRIKNEAVAKAFIFLPMAISFVGASVIWRFVYFFQPPGRPQIGLLNAIITSVGFEPIGWLITRDFALNTLMLIVIMIWLQTGFAMVILSAALKGVPGELLEAARIDGANEFEIFFKILVPYIRGTIITVTTTIAIGILKVFDIVFVMTSGQNQTEVIANRMYAEMFRFRDFGRGSALAVVLFLAVTPIIVSNIRDLRERRVR